MDDLKTARARAVLARVQVLRLERRTRDAQALWSAVTAGEVPGVSFGRVSEHDTPATVLGEYAAIEHALLLIRQDDDERYRQALETLDRVRMRLLPEVAADAVVTGERHRRLLSKLSVAYSQAGREAEAALLGERVLGVSAAQAGQWPTWGLDQIRRVISKIPPIRAADQLSNLATRAARLAGLDILGGRPDDLQRAAKALRAARDLATVSLELRRTPLGEQISRRALVGAELHRVRLLPAGEERLVRLETLSKEIWQLVGASHKVADNGRSTLMSRHALYGQALLDRAVLTDGDPRQHLAWLARVALRPMAAFHELDAVYDTGVGIAYGDACAVSGDMMRAHRAWSTVLRRLRRARPEAVAAAAAVERRLGSGQRSEQIAALVRRDRV
jgi:hypothetical protein